MSEEALDNPAPAAGPSEAPQPTSIVDTPEPIVAQPQAWPDSWRQDMSAGDDKQLKQLERLNSPMDLGKSFFEAQKKISSYKPAPEKPGEGATPEQLTAYRESLGVPEEASGYDLTFEDGTAISEDMQPQVDDFLKFAHENNTSPDVVKGIVNWQMKNVQTQQEAQKLTDDEARVNGRATLKSEWGGEYQGNMNAVHSLFTEAPEGTMDKLLLGRGEDGLQFGNNPDNVKWLVGLAKQVNPTSTLVPPGPDQAGSIDTEIESIHKIMNSPDKVERDKYWGSSDSANAMQKRLGDLNQAKQPR